MDRGLRFLKEAAIIIASGLAIALIITGAMSHFNTPTLEDFKREYAVGDVWNQKAVAQKYMKLFSVPELLQAIEDQNAAGNCHSQGHGIGRALYDANPNFAAVIKQCGGTCTQGCFHGAMMEMFKTDSDTLGGAVEDETPQTYLKHIQETALDLCDRPEVVSVTESRYCTHGLGHAFAYFSPDDIDGAIRSCEMLATKFDANSCASGAFMEYLFSASSSALLLEKGTAPCDRYPTHTQACYQFKAYGWLLAWGNVRTAIQACDTFGVHTSACILATAQAASYLKLLETRDGFEQICGGLTGEKRVTCISGALVKVIDLNNGYDTESLCKRVDPLYFEPCLKVARAYEDKMKSDR